MSSYWPYNNRRTPKTEIASVTHNSNFNAKTSNAIVEQIVTEISKLRAVETNPWKSGGLHTISSVKKIDDLQNPTTRPLWDLRCACFQNPTEKRLFHTRGSAAFAKMWSGNSRFFLHYKYHKKWFKISRILLLPFIFDISVTFCSPVIQTEFCFRIPDLVVFWWSGTCFGGFYTSKIFLGMRNGRTKRCVCILQRACRR